MASQQPPVLRHLPCADSEFLDASFGSFKFDPSVSDNYINHELILLFVSRDHELRFGRLLLCYAFKQFRTALFIDGLATAIAPFQPPLSGVIHESVVAASLLLVTISVGSLRSRRTVEHLPLPLSSDSAHAFTAGPCTSTAHNRFLTKPSDAELARRLAAA